MSSGKYYTKKQEKSLLTAREKGWQINMYFLTLQVDLSMVAVNILWLISNVSSSVQMTYSVQDSLDFFCTHLCVDYAFPPPSKLAKTTKTDKISDGLLIDMTEKAKICHIFLSALQNRRFYYEGSWRFRWRQWYRKTSFKQLSKTFPGSLSDSERTHILDLLYFKPAELSLTGSALDGNINK